MLNKELRPIASVDEPAFIGVAMNRRKGARKINRVEILILKFTFAPFHQAYNYSTGTVPSKTIVVAEGVRPEMCEFSVILGGEVLQIVYKCPMYMFNPGELSAKWLEGTRDGSLRPSGSQMTSAQQACKETIREYGS